MKTPEELKKGLVCCVVNGQDCRQCPQLYNVECLEMVMHDALAYIKRLEAERDDMRENVALRADLCELFARMGSADCSQSDFDCAKCAEAACQCRACIETAGKEGCEWRGKNNDD